MGTPHNDYKSMLEDTVKRVDKIEESLSDKEVRLAMLEAFKQDCIAHHIENDEKHKRLEDPVNRNTESNLLLAEAITEMNITMTKLADKVNVGQPVIDFWTNAGKAWTFNKMLWAGIVGLAVGIAAIAGAWKVM